jgi:histidyl-tRNA synthetase
LCNQHQRDQGAVERLLAVLQAKRFSALPEQLQAHPSLEALQKMITLLADAGITNVEFDSTLMRGFDYYTDIVFEIFDNHPDNNRSMLGGGRYDGLVGLFGVEPVPTVGFGFGDVTLANFLELHSLLPALHTETDAYVVLIGDVFSAVQKPIAEFRKAGLNLAVDVSGRKIGQQFQAAEKKGIHYVLIIGENEIASGQYTVKNLHTGAEEKHSVDRIVSIIRDYRHPDVDED